MENSNANDQVKITDKSTKHTEHFLEFLTEIVASDISYFQLKTSTPKKPPQYKLQTSQSIELDYEAIEQDLGLIITQTELDSNENNDDFKIDILNKFLVQSMSQNNLNLDPLLKTQQVNFNNKYFKMQSENDFDTSEDDRLTKIQKQFEIKLSSSNGQTIKYIRKMNIYLSPSGDELRIKLMGKYAMQNVLMSDIIDQTKFKGKDTQVWCKGKNYFVNKIINGEQVELTRDVNERERNSVDRHRMGNKEVIIAKCSECVVKDAAGFLKVQKYEQDQEQDRDIERLIQELVQKYLENMIKVQDAHYVSKNHESKSSFKQVEFLEFDQNDIKLDMKNHRINSDADIPKAIMECEWLRRSNKTSYFVIQSKLDQSDLKNQFVKININIDIIKTNVDSLENLKFIFDNEVKNMDMCVDKQIIISTNVINNETQNERLYAYVTFQKYYFLKMNQPIFIMYLCKQSIFDKTNSIIHDIHCNIYRSLILKNPINLPYSLSVSDFIKTESKFIHVFIGMDIAHKFKLDRSKSKLNSILTLTQSIGNTISDVKCKRLRLREEQREYPLFWEYEKLIYAILNETKQYLESINTNTTTYIPWINYIRDGLYQLSKNNNIDELWDLRESIKKVFPDFNLVQMNQVKDYDSIICSEDGKETKTIGISTDDQMNFEPRKMAQYTIANKPKKQGTRLLFQFIVHDEKGLLADKQLRVAFGFLLFALNQLSQTHSGIVNHPVFIQKADKDGKKLMILQKQLAFFNERNLIDKMELPDLIKMDN